MPASSKKTRWGGTQLIPFIAGGWNAPVFLSRWFALKGSEPVTRNKNNDDSRRWKDVDFSTIWC